MMALYTGMASGQYVLLYGYPGVSFGGKLCHSLQSDKDIVSVAYSGS